MLTTTAYAARSFRHDSGGPAFETSPSRGTAPSNRVRPSVPAEETPDNAAPGDAAPDEAELVKLFKLLADETRLRVLMALLRERELNVTTICQRLDQSQPAVSHHLALLRGAGIIESRRDGKHNFYRVRREHFESVMGGLFSSILEETPAA